MQPPPQELLLCCALAAGLQGGEHCRDAGRLCVLHMTVGIKLPALLTHPLAGTQVPELRRPQLPGSKWGVSHKPQLRRPPPPTGPLSFALPPAQTHA